LVSRSFRPLTSPAKKTYKEQEQWIAQLRGRRIGARRIQSELRRQHDCSLALATIHKVLTRQQQPLLKLSRRPRRMIQLYAKEVPGERIQMDTCKIGPSLYQYTAVDDCMRIRVPALYPRRTAGNTLLFLEKVIEEMPFPLQRIQTDRGREFFAYAFQEQLMAYGIKFRPIKPRSPHLNGKVERSQKTDWEEFYSTTDPTGADIKAQLEEWQDYYNQDRPHGSLNGRTPWERWQELLHQTPYRDEVESAYNVSTERIQHQDYRTDLKLRKLKEGL
jgi:transposase InsO family protein